MRELTRSAGVAARQVRYLIAKRFIPAPRGGRASAEYGDDPVAAIRRYRRLRELGFPPAATKLLAREGAAFFGRAGRRARDRPPPARQRHVPRAASRADRETPRRGAEGPRPERYQSCENSAWLSRPLRRAARLRGGAGGGPLVAKVHRPLRELVYMLTARRGQLLPQISVPYTRRMNRHPFVRALLVFPIEGRQPLAPILE